MHRVIRIVAMGALVGLSMGFDCTAVDVVGTAVAPPATTWVNASGSATVSVATYPFSLTIRDKLGNVVLETAPAKTPPDPADATRAYAPLASTHNTDETVPVIGVGWDYYRGEDGPWTQITRVTALEQTPATLTLHLATGLALEPLLTLTIESQGIGVHIVASIDAPAGAPDAVAPNRLSMAFVLHDDDHFLGLGERYVYTDHRGHLAYSWVEEDGFGHGEDAPISADNPSPSGPEQTHIPIPWIWDPRGFGVLFNTTYRTRYHLGDDAPDAFRFEAAEPRLDMTVFVDQDPKRLVAALTDVTGRAPEIADWILAPRRRADIGSGEMDKLRSAHVPTTMIDTALHYFPAGIGNLAATVKQVTSDIHKRGFKAICYFSSIVANSWHPVFDEAVAKGYLVKQPDGSPYLITAVPYYGGLVDFTNPEATAWYQGWLQQALDDGWDGWMYDFAEYVPLDAVMYNGMRGWEAHNLYPLLYQKAAFDLLEKQRKQNYLFFVRSGYAGTGGRVPMVWAGDQATDFDLADGLPAALIGALNLGMSGVPFWGSDISGYHYLFNPPPDKELYLRWTEVGAFSVDMHDENEGAGNTPSSDRWQIWKDQETLDTYRKYASLKTRMVPYTKLAVAEARANGMPVMRHLSLLYPKDVATYGIGDEYMYGDALLVAPVVSRGLSTRKVYLPDDAYFDFWTGARVAGHGSVDAAAPLDVVPVYAKQGGIVPLFSADVETLVPATDGSGVVSADQRADFLEAWIYAGGDTNVTLDDGTVISQSAPASAFEPGAPFGSSGALAPAASAADLATCDACFSTDPVARTLSVGLHAASETITAGLLSMSVTHSPVVKHYLLVVHY